MTLVTESTNETTPTNRKYPWDVWLDGGFHVLKRGEDFDCAPDSLRQQIYNRAYGKAKVSRKGDQITVRTSEPIITPQSGSGRPPKYPWELWTNGEQHLVKRGVDFTCNPPSLLVRLHAEAKNRGLAVSTSNRDYDTISFRFTGTTSIPNETWALWTNGMLHSVLLGQQLPSSRVKTTKILAAKATELGMTFDLSFNIVDTQTWVNFRFRQVTIALHRSGLG